MKSLAMAALALAAVATAAPTADAQARRQPGELRCGWLQNPTPANWWLRDRDGEWLISAQGGYEAPGMDVMPDMSTGDWVETNGSYGYGCACMRVRVDRRTERVTTVYSARPVPIAQCRRDRSLPRVE